MKKHLVMLTGAALLLALSASAKTRVSRYVVDIDEPVTAQILALAKADFEKQGGKIPVLTLAQCDNAGLEIAVREFPQITSMVLHKSPKLTSIEALKGLKLQTLTLNRLPALTDLSAIGSIKTLRNLKIDEVKFQHADLSFLAGLPNLSNFTLNGIPSTLKTISGIDKCPKISHLSFSRNNGPVDLAPLANFPKLKKIGLQYTNGLNLAPVAQMPALVSLDLYGAKNFDLAPLAASPKLNHIMIYATKGVKNYGDLALIKTLETVHAGLTPMNDLSWAPQLPKLKKLSLFAEQFKTFAPLAECKKLEDLSFWSMKGTVDVAQISCCTAPLKKLSFSGCRLANEAKIGDLARTARLTSLNLDDIARGKQVIDISFLKDFPTLQELKLRKTQIRNLEVVAELPNLKRITLDKAQKAKLEGKLKQNVRISAY